MLTLLLGVPPRPLTGSTSTTSADGTSANGAVNLLRLGILNTVADIGVAHMEGRVTVPAGGIKCTDPGQQVASVDPVTVGNEFTYTISIPSDGRLLPGAVQLRPDQHHRRRHGRTQSGTPRIQLLEASNGGVISNNTVTWANLGNYKLGGSTDCADH